MRKSWLVIVLLAFSCQLSAVSFEKSYKSAPLYEVLQDLETHFGLQFLYRPSDIAAAQPITTTIKTDDYKKALQQALGSSLNFTTRNGIIIITKAPEKKPAPTRVRSVIVKETPQIIIPDTLPEEEPREAWEAIPLLMPGEKLYVSPIDTLRISEINRQVSLIRTQNVETTSYISPITNNAFTHTFYTGLAIGYGSAANAQLDLRYGFYFHRNWGVGGGLNWHFAAQDSIGIWLQEGRIGIPLAVNTRWQFTPKWGIHGALGAGPAFMVYTGPTGTGIAHVATDIVPFAEIDAAYRFSPRATFLLGIYARFSALGASLEPWATGLHFGFLIGK